MKHAAFGVHMHSGWGVLVAVSGAPHAIEILARRRIVTADPEMPGAIQPYHYAMNLKLPESDKHLAKCAAASTRLAVAAIADLVKELNARQFHIVGSAVLLASRQTVPSRSRKMTRLCFSGSLNLPSGLCAGMASADLSAAIASS